MSGLYNVVFFFKFYNLIGHLSLFFDVNLSLFFGSLQQLSIARALHKVPVKSNIILTM